MKRTALYAMLTAAVALTLAPATHADCRRVIVHKPVPVVVEKVVAVAKVIELVTPVLPIYTVPPSYGALYVPPATAQAPQQLGADPCADVRAELQTLKLRLLSLERGPTTAPPLRTGPEDELRRLQLRLEELKQKQQAQPMPKADDKQPEALKSEPLRDGAGFAAWAASRCASCHDAGTAKLKGGGFTLLSGGKVAELKPEQAGETIRRLTLPDGHKDVMPPRDKLSAAERLEGVRLFVEGGS